MRRCIGTLFVFLCIASIVVAGCTNKESANVTPQIVYVTVLVTPTPTPEETKSATIIPGTAVPTISQEMEMDEVFLDYIDSNRIFDCMTVLNSARPGVYDVSGGYNVRAKETAEQLTALLARTKPPGSEKMKAYRSAMMNALGAMDGSTAGFTRYHDAMQTVIVTKNDALAELHSSGSPVVDEIHLIGHGNDVQPFNTTETGLNTFTLHHTGVSNFAVTLKDKDGKYLSLLVNEIGEYSGKKSETLGAGNYTLEITADGDWTIGITTV